MGCSTHFNKIVHTQAVTGPYLLTHLYWQTPSGRCPYPVPLLSGWVTSVAACLVDSLLTVNMQAPARIESRIRDQQLIRCLRQVTMHTICQQHSSLLIKNSICCLAVPCYIVQEAAEHYTCVCTTSSCHPVPLAWTSIHQPSNITAKSRR
jgi:hypothetical protein